ncbi:helix-turn-helix transcriptional regulator [Streptomyces fradiae]|uniref:helix-turn-helix transcriptional regulator n=1 Tax=Streptomyces fradiae TaxID=1906 RepID=UPI00201917D5|nr:helix-turn-helix transcriptional regulator [Streptomyces fradiae]UQS29417.1 helix-turn-helix transcriptional regulator [Streptomyces fradiae]
MAERAETDLLRLLTGALAEGGRARPVLLLVEGAAGTGKSRLLSRLLSALPVPARTGIDGIRDGIDDDEIRDDRGRDDRGRGGRDDRGPGDRGPGHGGRGDAVPGDGIRGDGLRSGGIPGGEAPGAAAIGGTAGAERPGHGPLLLAVDDVHRAAPADIAALGALLADPPGRFACVLTYRPEELPEPGLVLGPGTDFPAALAVVRHTLGPLGPAAVAERAAAALGLDACPPDLAAALHRASGGNAQTVADLLDALAPRAADRPAPRPADRPAPPGTGERPASAHDGRPAPPGPVGRHAPPGHGESRPAPGPEDVEAVGPPPRLTALTLRRAAAVPERYRAVVHAAAVLDHPASARDLAAVAGLDGRAGRDALVAALRAAALQELPDGRYGFAVPLAAAAVRGAVAGPVREALHERAAALLARRQPVPWERLAGHRRACGDRRGWLRAVERAAQEHADRGDVENAVGLLESALATGPVPPHARSRLALMLARSAVMGLGSQPTRKVLEHILDDPRLAQAVRGEIRLDLGLLLCNQLGRAQEGQAELERAVDDLAGHPVPLARAMSALAMPYWPGLPLADNIAWMDRALAVATESGDPVVQTAAAANRVSVLLNTGDPGAWPLIERLPRDSDVVGCRQQAARGLCNAADAAVWLGRYAETRDLLEEGVALAARSGAAYAERTGRGTLLVLDWATGSWDGLADRARALVREAQGMPNIASDALTVLGLLALARGEWADIHEYLTGPGALGVDRSPVPLSAAASGALIRLALARDETGPAAAEAADAWRRLRAKGVWAWGAELAPWAVEATARAGAVPAAREMTAEFAAGLEGRDAPSADAALLWTRGVLAEHTGDPEAAVRHYEAASAAYAALPHPYHELLTAAAGARRALAAGREDAVAVLADCADRFDALGAAWDAARTRAELREHLPAEERRGPGRPGYGDVLSPREAEVAELAGAGMTNRDIAAALHLSPRTVEQHVARALRKTGARSRQQLAAALRTGPAALRTGPAAR